MAKTRLSRAQQVTLTHLAQGKYLAWGAPPHIVDSKGAYLYRAPYQTAITLRQRNMIAKDPTTGWYVITDEGRRVLADVGVNRDGATQ